MSLLEHAEKEMQLAGLYDELSDYGGMIPEAVLALIKAHSGRGHSGGSHWLTIKIFTQLINYKTLTPITSNPDEWVDMSESCGGNPVWQNKRMTSCFSVDGGKTWYDIDDKKRRNWPNNKWWIKLRNKIFYS